MQKKITSSQNNLIKKILTLKDKPKIRKKLGLFVIEGEREIRTAINNGYEIKNLLFTPEIFDSKKIESISKKKNKYNFNYKKNLFKNSSPKQQRGFNSSSKNKISLSRKFNS